MELLRKRSFAQQSFERLESQHFELQKAVAIALPLATGLRNEALAYDFGRLV